MKNVISTLVIATFCLFSGCDSPERKSERAAVADGYDVLPVAKSLRDKFGGWSSIKNFHFDSLEKEWKTIVFVNGRYEVTFTQNVRFAPATGSVVISVGEGSIKVDEITRVSSEEGIFEFEWKEMDRVIKGGELDKLVESDWDFSSVGIELLTEPTDNIELLIKERDREHPHQDPVYSP